MAYIFSYECVTSWEATSLMTRPMTQEARMILGQVMPHSMASPLAPMTTKARHATCMQQLLGTENRRCSSTVTGVSLSSRHFASLQQHFVASISCISSMIYLFFTGKLIVYIYTYFFHIADFLTSEHKRNRSFISIGVNF